MAHLHDFRFEILHSCVRTAVLAALPCVGWSFHVGKQRHFLNPQRIDYDMHMNVAAVVMPVRVGAYKGLAGGFTYFPQDFKLQGGKPLFYVVLGIPVNMPIFNIRDPGTLAVIPYGFDTRSYSGSIRTFSRSLVLVPADNGIVICIFLCPMIIDQDLIWLV